MHNRQILSFKRWARLTVLGVLILAIAGCSRTFAYRFADTYLVWQARSYVSMDRSQRSELRREIKILLQWHAEQEMPLYVSLLQELSDDIRDQKFTAQRYDYYQDQIDQRWVAVREQLMPPALDLLPLLSDQQTTQLIDKLNEQVDEREQEFLERAQADTTSDETENDGGLVTKLERWLGQVSDTQVQIVEQWIAQSPAMASLWLSYRRGWAAGFADALALRQQPLSFAESLEPLILRPELERSSELTEAIRQADAVSRKHIIELANSLSEEQRQHFIQQIHDLQRDIARMARTRKVSIDYLAQD